MKRLERKQYRPLAFGYNHHILSITSLINYKNINYSLVLPQNTTASSKSSLNILTLSIFFYI